MKQIYLFARDFLFGYSFYKYFVSNYYMFGFTEGTSMSPTLNANYPSPSTRALMANDSKFSLRNIRQKILNRDFLLLKVTPHGKPYTPELGQIVVVQNPTITFENDNFFIKRIFATEGQLVKVTDVNTNKLLYVSKVPKGHVWIQGDNLVSSFDSRSFGPVPVGLIRGVLLYRIFPNPQKFFAGQ